MRCSLAKGLLRLAISTPDGGTRDVAVGTSTMLGRSSKADVHLPYDGVSREHATLVFEGGAWWVRDMGSRNGTYVNDQRVEAWELRPGDRIGLGAVKMEVGGFASRPSQRLGVPWEVMAAKVPVVDKVDTRNLSTFQPVAAQRDTQQLRQDYETLRAAHALSARIAGLRELDTILQSILDFCLETLPVDVVAVLLRDGRGELTPRHVRTAGEGDAEIVVSRSVLAELERTRAALLISDAQTDDRIAGAQSVMLSGLRSVLAVPIIVGDTIQGAIVADNRDRRAAFRGEELHMLSGIAAQSGLALENLDLVHQVANETALRGELSRFLAPELVEQVVAGSLDLDGSARKARIVALYCDIRGFTAMSAMLGPAATMDLLNDHFAGLMGVVFEHGGMVHQLTGDELLALWGVVGARPDDLDRALDCAVAIQARIRADNDRRAAGGRPTVRCGIGVETGQAVVGLLGADSRVQYSIVGSVMNIGARFCSLAGGGEVVARTDVVRPFADRFELRELPPANLKGVTGPVDVCTVWPRES